MSISLNHVRKNYGTQIAVNDISFEVANGEIVGFLGPNGAGKSTTMKMITGFLQPDAGKITVEGIDVSLNPLDIKQKIGYLPESNPLYYDLYVREYLSFIAGIHQIKDKKTAIERVISTTGLSRECHKMIGQLSKGYKQRVGLAAALIHDPRVLILDEPTTGLDPNQIIEIREVIRNLGNEKTILFSSHILQEVESLCQRVIIIHNGNIVANDRLENLKKGESASRIRVQFEQTLEDQWLLRIPDVISAEKIDGYQWLIETNNPSNLNKQLLELALQHNLNIVSLQTETRVLEDIFRSLTGNNQ